MCSYRLCLDTNEVEKKSCIVVIVVKCGPWSFDELRLSPCIIMSPELALYSEANVILIVAHRNVFFIAVVVGDTVVPYTVLLVVGCRAVMRMASSSTCIRYSFFAVL